MLKAYFYSQKMCSMKRGKHILHLILNTDHFRNLKGSDFQKDRQGCRRKVNLPVERKRGLFIGDVSEIARRLPDGYVQYGWSGNGGYLSRADEVSGWKIVADWYLSGWTGYIQKNTGFARYSVWYIIRVLPVRRNSKYSVKKCHSDSVCEPLPA